MRTSSRREFLGRICAWAFWGLGAGPALSGFIYGCKTMGAGGSIEIGGIKIDTDSIVKSASAISKSFEDITPEQEYYIGRTVGAMVLQRYQPYDKPAANRYINILGQTLAQASDLPETYGGYRFLVQDSDEINAFAAPGGLIFVTRGILRCCRHEDAVAAVLAHEIFVTRGILRCCRHEDAVAAVLAHEIGHVQYKHGLQAIKKSRVTAALTTLAIEGTKTFGGEDLAGLTRTFENSISDISSTLIVNGYSRSFEYQADLAATVILQRVGYNPGGLVDMLNVMDQRLKPEGLDFAKTHPAPTKRISEIESYLSYSKVQSPASRQARFKRALGSI
jgi:predicted Zn-dependent protease